MNNASAPAPRMAVGVFIFSIEAGRGCATMAGQYGMRVFRGLSTLAKMGKTIRRWRNHVECGYGVGLYMTIKVEA